ncbi:MAG: hypothetical protein EOO43_04685 [Flavobacterium sp.]|nr:MAG: hypothetical protein EOO43_04685 [Flavobacterium sp.]
MNTTLFVEPKVTSVKKFYFLEYFYILLKSVKQFSNKDEIFESFRVYKDGFQLGESKYKKLGSTGEELTRERLLRYEYTFKEVIEESELYGLIKRKQDEYFITKEGDDLIRKYETNVEDFNFSIFNFIESKLFGFYYLVSSCYKANRSKQGLLIFPIYSPPKLDIQKKQITKTKDVINYINVLTKKIAQDINEHLDIQADLNSAKDNLISKLQSAELISESLEAGFNTENYNVILKRIRDFWLSYFLNEVYKIQMSISYFDIWCYRGRQLGIMNATEFYYNFDGKIIYPISILSQGVSNPDFKNIYQYPDGNCLYIHSPKFDNIIEQFTKSVYESYIDLKSRYKTYFINLADLRDLVCFKLKISYENFASFLENLYQLNLRNEVKIKISLEGDKLPSETKAMYLKREPIMVDGRICNIIAVDIKK